MLGVGRYTFLDDRVASGVELFDRGRLFTLNGDFTGLHLLVFRNRHLQYA